MDDVDPGEVAKANRTYFRALAVTRAGMGQLPMLAFASVGVLAAVTFTGLNALVFWNGVYSYLGLFITHVVVMGVCGVFWLVSFFKRVVYRLQVFFSSVIAGLAAVVAYSCCMLGATLASYDAQGQRIFPQLFGVMVTACVVSLAGAVGAQVLLLRRRLRVGHSEKWTLANFAAVSPGNRSRIFWIGLPLVTVGPNLLTQGQYVVNTVGAVILVVLIVILSRLPVEFGYLAYLKSQDRGYWEKPPRARAKRPRSKR